MGNHSTVPKNHPIRLPWSATLFNVRPERLIPWLYVEPPSADEVPGFRMNADGSTRSDFGTPMGPLAPRYSELPQALAGAPGAPWAMPGLADYEAGLGLVDSGNGVPRQERPWTNWMPTALQDYSATGPVSAPPGVEPPPQPSVPQLPEWLRRVLTMPVPQRSTAYDPRTGTRVIPYEPLAGSIRPYLMTSAYSPETNDIPPTDDFAWPDVETVEAPDVERRPSSDTAVPATNIDAGPLARTEAAPEWMTGDAWMWPPNDGRYPPSDTVTGEQSWPSPMIPQPVALSTPDHNFILANVAGTDELQAQQPTAQPLAQLAETIEPIGPAESSTEPPQRLNRPELAQALENHRRAAAEEVDALVRSIATFGGRIYEDSILKAQDDLARLAERLRNDPWETAESIFNSFPATRVGGKAVGGLAAVLTILANARRGLEFEKAVLQALNGLESAARFTKNTQKISVDGLGRSVPDVLKRGIREIKSGVEINNTIQIRVQAAYAKLFGIPFSLIVSPSTSRISQTVKDAVYKTGGTIQRFDPATGAFTPYK